MKRFTVKHCQQSIALIKFSDGTISTFVVFNKNCWKLTFYIFLNGVLRLQ